MRSRRERQRVGAIARHDRAASARRHLGPRPRRGGTTRVSRYLPVLAAVFGGLAFLVLTDGGRQTRRSQPILTQLDAFAEYVGFGFDQAWISGHRKTSDRDILAILNMRGARSLFTFDKADARARIEQLPWVAQARVLTVWPRRVEVQIREHEPSAVWRQPDHDLLISRDGRTLDRIGINARTDLPIIAGKGAPAQITKLRRLLQSYPELARHLLVSHWVGERRWILHLRDGRRIQLPEKDAFNALAQIMSGQGTGRLFDKQFAEIDLRDPAAIRARLVTPSRGKGAS